MHLSSTLIVTLSSALALALNSLLTLWSSANPLSHKPFGTTSCRGEQYRLKIFAPAQLPCGTLRVKSLGLLQCPFMEILKDIGLRYCSNHLRAVSSIPYLALRICSRVSWSTVSKAAERSIATRLMMDCFSMAQRMSLLIPKTVVLQE